MTRRSRILLWLALTLTLLCVAAALTAWIARKPLLQKLVGNYLQSKGVAGRYQIDSLDRDHIVLSNVMIGTTAAPALTAKTMRIDLDWVGLNPKPQKIVLNHAVLRAVVTSRSVSFGDIDALIPQSTGPLVLPAVEAEIHDTTVLVKTPYGAVKTHMNAQGVLNKNYTAHIDIEPAALNSAGYTFNNVRGQLDVHIEPYTYSMDAMLNTDPVAFSGCHTGPLLMKSKAKAPQTLKDFQLDATVTTPALACGHSKARNIAVASHAHYGIDQHLLGTLRATATDIALSAGSAKSAACVGNYDISTQNKAQCQVYLDNAAVSAVLLNPINRLQASLRNGSFETVANGPLAAIETATQHMKIDSHVAADWQGRKATVVADALHVRGQNGVDISTTPATTLTLHFPENHIDASGVITLSGSTLPNMRLDLKAFQINSTKSIVANGSVATSGLNLGSVTAQATTIGFQYADSLVLNGQTVISGTLGNMHIERARMPLNFTLSKSGTLSVTSQNNCIPIQIQGLKSATFALGAIDTRLCAHPGQPLFIRSPKGDVQGGGHIVPLNFDIKLASQPTPLHVIDKSFDIAISGTQNNPYLKGNFFDLSTTLASYALTISKASGAWQWSSANGFNLLHTKLDATDQTVRPRFNLITLSAFDAHFNQGTLAAQGVIRNGNSVYLGHFDLNHAMESNAGHLAIDTTGLEFGAKLQPFELSELLRGVVENVNGGLDTKALISWSGSTITSLADATIKAMSLATATLGPVSGINGHIFFDDLFRRTTPPGQRLYIASLNPGIAISDGIIQFQLLPDLHMKIEDARWPFADGVLRLEPVTLVPGDTEHNMTVAIDKIDVAQFLQQMEFKDLNATGHLTGIFPMVFNTKGGRIEHGVLKAAPGGGIIQYVGNTGGAATGQAKIAFDALRDFKYDNISLDVNGDLDGEIITSINFSGVNQVPIKPIGRWTTGAKNVPFKFGVNVKAPFRSLLKSVTSFTDARQIIREGTSPDSGNTKK